MTISFWVNLERRNYTGTGYESNPMIRVRNGPGEDFVNALGVGYDSYSKIIGVCATQDSTHEALAVDHELFQFNKWYHIAAVCNNSFLALYVDGKLKEKTKKQFETRFSETDSMMVGHTASKKNERMAVGAFDDIYIYHRALSDSEIEALYVAPNPNRLRNFMNEAVKYVLLSLILGGTVVFFIIRNKRALKKQKEQLELRNRISELEIKVIKTQMNPHFLSNSLAAIQSLIFQKEVDKAGRYLAKFSYFLRQVLEYSEKNYVTLEEELNIIKLNIELEQLRFKNNFSFNLFIEEGVDLADILIPTLITHPFIENAIWHGLLPLEERSPQLSISVYIKTGIAHISIEDNGVGRSISDESPIKKSMGIKMVYDKIESINQLRNSSDFKLEIIDLYKTDKTSCGTRVVIRLTNNSF